MRLRRWWIALAVAACAAAACKGGDRAPDCKAAPGAYAGLVKRQVEIDQASDPKTKARALSLIPQLKDEMARTCQEASWSDETRRCITGAKSLPDLERCTPNQEKKEEAAAAAPADDQAPEAKDQTDEGATGAAPGGAEPGGAGAPEGADPAP